MNGRYAWELPQFYVALIKGEILNCQPMAESPPMTHEIKAVGTTDGFSL
jgi:hypothetical protein